MSKFSSAAALREHLGPERPRTFPEILLLVLDAAEEDATMLDYEGRGTARDVLAEATGQDIYGLVRTILETLLDAATPDHDDSGCDPYAPEAAGT